MTGPEHYKAAEDLIIGARVIEGEGADMTAVFTWAQVHATLALAAATALAVGVPDYGINQDEYEAWEQAAGYPWRRGPLKPPGVPGPVEPSPDGP